MVKSVKTKERGGKQMKPDVSDEEIGIRSFQLKKKKAVEQAIEKIRYNLNEDWAGLVNEDIELLEWVLGDMWAFIARDQWDRIAFSELRLPDIYRIIDIAKQIMARKKVGSVGLNQIHNMVKKLAEE